MSKLALFRPTVVIVPGLWFSGSHYAELRNWLTLLGFSVDIPKTHAVGGLEDKARALANRLCRLQGGECHRDCIIVAHSFGALESHYMMGLYPELQKMMHGFVSISGVGPRGFEPAVLKQITKKYLRERIRQLRGEEFLIPSLDIFQDLFGEEMELEDWKNLHGESSPFMCFFMARSFFVRDLVTTSSVSTETEKLFLAGTDDKLVTERSLLAWRQYYHGNNSFEFRTVPGTHGGVLLQEATFVTIGEWLDSHFTWYVPPNSSYRPGL